MKWPSEKSGYVKIKITINQSFPAVMLSEGHTRNWQVDHARIFHGMPNLGLPSSTDSCAVVVFSASWREYTQTLGVTWRLSWVSPGDLVCLLQWISGYHLTDHSVGIQDPLYGILSGVKPSRSFSLMDLQISFTSFKHMSTARSSISLVNDNFQGYYTHSLSLLLSLSLSVISTRVLILPTTL